MCCSEWIDASFMVNKYHNGTINEVFMRGNIEWKILNTFRTMINLLILEWIGHFNILFHVLRDNKIGEKGGESIGNGISKCVGLK